MSIYMIFLKNACLSRYIAKLHMTIIVMQCHRVYNNHVFHVVPVSVLLVMNFTI